MKDTNLRSLKQYLSNRTKEQLITEIAELFIKFEYVKDYYHVKLHHGQDDTAVRDKYKAIIENEFFPKRGGFSNDFPRLSVARKAVTDYKKMAPSPAGIADLMLFYVEMGVRFTNTYGDIDEPFYNSMESMYERAVKYIIEHEMQELFETQCQQIVADTSGIGWGFHDQLSYLYEEHFA